MKGPWCSTLHCTHLLLNEARRAEVFFHSFTLGLPFYYGPNVFTSAFFSLIVNPLTWNMLQKINAPMRKLFVFSSLQNFCILGREGGATGPTSPLLASILCDQLDQTILVIAKIVLACLVRQMKVHVTKVGICINVAKTTISTMFLSYLLTKSFINISDRSRASRWVIIET